MIDLSITSLGFTALPFIGSIYGSTVQKKSNDWYKKLKRPWFCPPNYVFPIAWTYLYGTMGYASYMIYRDGGGFDGVARTPLIIYGSQLAVNWCFTPLFFGMRQLGWGSVNCAVLWAMVGGLMKSFYEVNPTAGLLMIPYQAWLTLATAISTKIWLDNPKPIKD